MKELDKEELSIKDLPILKNILLFKGFLFKDSYHISYFNKKLIFFYKQEEILFVTLATNYLILEIYLRYNSYFNEIYKSYLELKTILEFENNWKITIYSIRINGDLFLTYFLKYKYSKNEAEEKISYFM